MNTFTRRTVHTRLLAFVAAALVAQAVGSQDAVAPLVASSAFAARASATLPATAYASGVRTSRQCDAVDAFGNPVRPCRSR